MMGHQVGTKKKLEWPKPAQAPGTVSRSRKFSRSSHDSSYRLQELHANGREDALQEIRRQQPDLKNRIDPVIEAAVVAMSIEQPAFGQYRVSSELRKRGTFVSCSSVRTIWLRHGLETFSKRLKALSARVAQDGFMLGGFNGSVQHLSTIIWLERWNKCRKPEDFQCLSALRYGAGIRLESRSQA